ncbi:MAG: D-alanine--D-alanine ligase [Burkholderiales bacterium]|jgi:D-alanine-D-alanine ligase|nr:D-alanine--D-alanine ligase [Burkholderiales bacterium]
MEKETTDFGKVAVLLGGHSAEREVSLMSGRNVLSALQAQGIDARAFDPAEKPLWTLKDEGFTRVFNMLHGRGGEDGTVQAVLETLGIPYTGSGVAASALAMDKWRTKMVWLTAGIPTPPYQVVDARTDWTQLVDTLGLPLILKPAHEGSSIGIVRIDHADSRRLAEAYTEAARHDPLVIAEAFIQGVELTAAVVDGCTLPLVRIAAPDGNYDYEHKYFSDDTQYFCPSGLPEALEERIRTQALAAFQVLGCCGWGRLDVMLRDDGQWFFLEANTVPGMTAHSLVPMAARAAGMSMETLCLAILKGTLSKYVA